MSDKKILNDVLNLKADVFSTSADHYLPAVKCLLYDIRFSLSTTTNSFGCYIFRPSTSGDISYKIIFVIHIQTCVACLFIPLN